MHEKGEFLKLREAFTTFPQKLQIHAMLYQGQQFPMDIVKSKRELKYMGHVYFEPVRPHIDIQGKNGGVTEKIIIDV